MPYSDEIFEFKYAIRDITHHVLSLDSEYDRVRCCEWVRKLASISNNSLENSKLRNDYIQYLRIIVRSGVLHGIFLEPPPTGTLKPLTEAVGSNIVKNVPKLPPVGPIAPYISHRSPDGRAYISIKRVPGKGILCYMAVTPEGMTC